MWKSAQEIASEAQDALDNMGHKTLKERAVGTLVFPSVVKAGLGIGGQYGEGILIAEGQANRFYNLASVSVGWQLGVQSRTMAFFFMTEKALDEFRTGNGWNAGIDASVSVLDADAGLDIDLNEINEPVVAIVTDRSGLMYNLSIEGTKITEIDKD